MSRFASSVGLSLRAALRGLGAPGFWVLFLMALVLWAAAFQNKREYSVDVAGMAYHPYIDGFHEIERQPGAGGIAYRWSGGTPQVLLPGIGNEPVILTITTIGNRPSGGPPSVDLAVRGQIYSLQTGQGEQTQQFFVPRGDAWDGDVRVSMTVPTFTLPPDPRELGVIIRRVTVTPADYGLRPLVVPPAGEFAWLLTGAGATYLFLLITTRRRTWALAAMAANITLTAYEIVAFRPELGFHAGQLPTLWAWGLGLGLLGRAGLDAALGAHVSGCRLEQAAALGSLAFATAFMLRFGGLTYAQFLTSDLMLHVHNAQDVIAGTWVFTERLPDGTPQPYPPALYLLVAASSLVFGGGEEALSVLLKWLTSVLDAATCLALAWAGARVMPNARAGGYAALAYLAIPSAFDLFSAGNYTNLFAQSMLNLTLLGGIVVLGVRGTQVRPWHIALLGAGFCLTMLGHYGMMLSTLPIAVMFGLWALASGQSRRDGRAWALLAAWGLALGASFALYYWRFSAVILEQLSAPMNRLFGAQPASQTNRPGIAQSLARLPSKAGELLGWPAVLAGLSGLGLKAQTRAAARALLASWLLSAALFALIDAMLGDAVRWYYLGAAALALPAGALLASLAARRRWAAVLVVIALFAMVAQMVFYWLNLIFTRYH